MSNKINCFIVYYESFWSSDLSEKINLRKPISNYVWNIFYLKNDLFFYKMQLVFH